MKRFLSLMLAVALMLTLVACGAGKDDSVTTTTAHTTTTTTAHTTTTTTAFKKPATYASVVTITINPEFRLYLDAAGEVLAVEPINADAGQVMAAVSAQTGSVETVVQSLVAASNESGFVKKDATVAIAVTEVTDDTVNVEQVLAKVEAAANTEFQALQVTVEIQTTVAQTVSTVATTTTTVKATTTTTPGYTAVTAINGSWNALYPMGDMLYTVMLFLFGESDYGVSLGLGDPLSSMSEEEQEMLRPHAEEYDGKYYYFGRGDGDELAAISENGTVVTVTDSSGAVLTLARTSETTLTVTASPDEFSVLDKIPVGTVFTYTTPEA